MANFPPPPPQSSALLLFLLIITSLSTSSSAADGIRSVTAFLEHQTMLDSLRSHGYTLFTNAISTSDLQYQLLPNAAAASAVSVASVVADSTSRFTLFAPLDDLLFALDMASDAATYVNTLRYHIIPNHRHTFADLQNLSSPFVDTLLPDYAVLIGRTQEPDLSSANATVNGVMVDGVRVSNPDLFLGSRIAVHGIDGILLTGLNMNQDLDGNDNGSPPMESPAPLSGFDRKNIPAEETQIPPTSRFDWENAPAVSPPLDWNTPATAPSFDGNTPVVSTPKILQDQAEKLKNLKKKKKKVGKRHLSGHGHHRRHGRLRRDDDL